MTSFTKQDSRYTWEINDGVLHIFPKEEFRDLLLEELLAVRVARFSVKRNTSCWDFEDRLFGTPEIQAIVEANDIDRSGLNFTGAYIPQLGRDFSLNVSNMTLVDILNKVIKESPVARFWMIKKNSSSRTVLVRLNARHEPDGSRR